MKILHVISGTIMEVDMTKNTLNYLFFVAMEKLDRNDKEWERARRFIDKMDLYKVHKSSDRSYYVDIAEIRKEMCIDEFEILDG